MLLPPSAVNRFRMRTLRYVTPILWILHELVAPGSVVISAWSMAEGANSKASPTSKPAICEKRPDASPVAVSAEAAAKCLLRVWSHAGDVNLCTSVIEQRSRSCGEIVGSCVAMMMRHARCLCSRTTLIRESVSLLAPVEFFINCCRIRLWIC